jgi:hypothetical protein
VVVCALSMITAIIALTKKASTFRSRSNCVGTFIRDTIRYSFSFDWSGASLRITLWIQWLIDMNRTNCIIARGGARNRENIVCAKLAAFHRRESKPRIISVIKNQSTINRLFASYAHRSDTKCRESTSRNYPIFQLEPSLRQPCDRLFDNVG